eukprot:COSAG06_NODE_33385_length_490_cov_4.989770_2_plen_72_part_00
MIYDTLKVINDLGGLRLREKRLSEAESLFRHVVLGNEKLLGANDPRTLNTANSLAKWIGRRRFDRRTASID